MGLIGERDHKQFCCSPISACKIAKHEGGGGGGSTGLGLFICIPKKQEQAFTVPFLPNACLEAPLLENFLIAEKIIDDWTAIFAQILATGEKLSEERWGDLQELWTRSKSSKTSRKKAKIKEELNDKLSNLAFDLQDIKNT